MTRNKNLRKFKNTRSTKINFIIRFIIRFSKRLNKWKRKSKTNKFHRWTESEEKKIENPGRKKIV